MMTELRKLRDGEAEAFVRSVRIPFLDPAVDAEDQIEVEFWVGLIEPDRTWVVDDGGRFVGNCCTFSMDLSVPAGAGRECPVLPMAGVSAVGVHPTHRRRGLLGEMMTEMLADARRRQEPLAGLIASESVIYGRFGFGCATDRQTVTIESRRTALVRAAPARPVHLVDPDEAIKVLPPLLDRIRRTRPGDPNRSWAVWQRYIEDPASRRRGGAGAFTAVCDGGFARYRSTRAGGRSVLVVEDLRGESPEVEAGLWEFLFGIDLVDVIEARRRPVDEPLRWRLADPRQLRVTHREDYLWLRVLDVPAALEGRGYDHAGRLVLDLQPPAAGPTDDPAVGRWVLEAGPDGAACRPAGPSERADLAMEVTDLGSLYLGGFRAGELAAGGRVQELTPGSVASADALFATPLAPFSGTGF